MYLQKKAFRQISLTFAVFFLFLLEGNIAAQPLIQSPDSFTFTKVANLGASVNYAVSTYNIKNTNKMVILTSRANLYLYDFDKKSMISEVLIGGNQLYPNFVAGYYDGKVLVVADYKVLYLVDLMTGARAVVDSFITDFGLTYKPIVNLKVIGNDDSKVVLTGSFDSIAGRANTPKLFAEYDMKTGQYNALFNQNQRGSDIILFEGKYFYSHFGDKNQQNSDWRLVEYYDINEKAIKPVNIIDNTGVHSFTICNGVLYAIASIYKDDVHDWRVCLFKYDSKTNTFNPLYFGVAPIVSVKGSLYMSTSKQIIEYGTNKVIEANYFLILDSNGQMRKSNGTIDYIGLPVSKMYATRDFVSLAYRDLYLFSDGTPSGVGIKSTFKSEDFQIYPNPAKTGDNITINFPKFLDGTIVVYSLDGRVITTVKVTNEQHVTVSVPMGTYYIVIKNNEFTLSRKLIIL